MNVRIKELPESLTLDGSDVFPVDKSSNITSKVTIETFKSYIIDYLTQYFADDVTLSLDETQNVFSVKNVFLPLSGGTMTGFITLNSAPTDPLHPVSKGYVDALVGALDADGKLKYVKLTGDIMTGPLRVQSTITSTGKLSSAGGLDVIGSTALSGTLDTTQNVNVGATLNVGQALNVTGVSTFNNTVEFTNKKIQHFTANVKTVSLGNAPNNEYTLTLDDNGAILSVAGTGSVCKVFCPANLPVGFNVMLIQNSASTVFILPTPSSGVTVAQVDAHYSIRKQYGVCNIVSINTNVFVIAGDLS